MVALYGLSIVYGDERGLVTKGAPAKPWVQRVAADISARRKEYDSAHEEMHAAESKNAQAWREVMLTHRQTGHEGPYPEATETAREVERLRFKRYEARQRLESILETSLAEHAPTLKLKVADPVQSLAYILVVTHHFAKNEASDTEINRRELNQFLSQHHYAPSKLIPYTAGPDGITNSLQPFSLDENEIAQQADDLVSACAYACGRLEERIQRAIRGWDAQRRQELLTTTYPWSLYALVSVLEKLTVEAKQVRTQFDATYYRRELAPSRIEEAQVLALFMHDECGLSWDTLDGHAEQEMNVSLRPTRKGKGEPSSSLKQLAGNHRRGIADYLDKYAKHVRPDGFAYAVQHLASITAPELSFRGRSDKETSSGLASDLNS